jgi:hypothetical protein
MAMLILDKNDEKREIEFELEFQRTLTLQERISMLEERRRFIQQQMSKYGNRRSFEIIKRS